MKKNLILITFSCLFLFFWAQTYAQKIGFCMDDLYAERWKTDSLMFCENVRKIGGDPIVKVANNDSEVQLQQVKELIANGVEVIVIIPADAQEAGKIVNYAKSKEVPVIAYDRLIMNCDLDYYISFDNILVGEMQAQYALKNKPSGNYVIMNGPVSDNNSLLFKQGQMNILKPQIESGAINVVFNEHIGEWTPLEGFVALNNFMLTHEGPLDAVVAANDGLAEGVGDVLDIFGGENVLVTGQDGDPLALQRILNGKQSMTVYKPITKIAKRSAEVAMSLAKHGDISGVNDKINNKFKDVGYIKLAPIAIDISNIHEHFPELNPSVEHK